MNVRTARLMFLARNLSQNDAESVLFHTGHERSDCIRSWHAVRTLSTGAMNRRSWDADQSGMREHDERSRHDQGPMGNQFASSMENNLVDPPQTGIDHVDC